MDQCTIIIIRIIIKQVQETMTDGSMTKVTYSLFTR